MKAPLINRKIHRWGAILSALPVLIVIVSGLFLQLKKQSHWIQPPTQRGSAQEPTLPFEQILNISQSVPEANIHSWNDIDRLDVRPGKGVVKVRATNHWEIQIDTKTGEILHVSMRRSDLIESLHDGSFFHEKAKLWVFFPSAVILLLLLISGIYLFLLPHLARRRRRKAAPQE